jgi:vitamin B12 transporter
MPGRVMNNGGKGTVNSMFFNGARSEDTVVMLDGIRISDKNMGVSMSNFSLAGVERVEMLAGAASTLYGADAHGGVISMYSDASNTEGLNGYVLGQTSTLGQLRTEVKAIYNWGGGWIQGTVDLEQHPQATDTENPYRNASGHIGFGQQFGNSTVTLNHRTQYKGVPMPWNWGYDEAWSPAREYAYDREATIRQGITTASLKTAFSDNLYGELNLGNITQENNSGGYPSKLERFQGNALFNLRNDMGGATLLLDLQDEKYWGNETTYDPVTWDEVVTMVTDPAKGQHIAVALEGNIEATQMLRFVASLRQQSDTAKQPGTDSEDASQLTWKVGANFLMPSGFRAYASVGTAFNTPSLYQFASTQAFDKPAPGNEESQSIMLGVGYAESIWWVRADASRINYTNLIDYVSAPAQQNGYYGWYENLGKVRVQGIEISGGVKGDNWTSEIFVRSQEGRNLELPKEIQPPPENSWESQAPHQLMWFQNRPFFSAGIRGSYTLDKFNFGLNASYIGHRYVYSSDVRPGAPYGGTAPEKTHYIDATIFAEYKFNDALSATLRAERLFQDGLTREEWEKGEDIGRNNMALVPGYPSFGRALSLEVKYKF